MKKILILALALTMPFVASAHEGSHENELSIVVDVGAGVNATVGSSTSGGASVTGDVKTGVDASADSDAVIQVQVGGDTSVTSETTTGNSDFEVYAEGVSSTHENVSAVDVDAGGEVEVAYKHKGWLFGFIPVTVTSRTTIEAPAESAGSVEATVSMPWWSFLVSGVSGIKASTETELSTNTTVRSEAAIGARAEASAQARIKLVEAVISSISKVDANVRASYDLKANTK